MKECYYLLDKESGVTSCPMDWEALTAGFESGQWDAATPVTQEGARAWCSLGELMAGGSHARVEDVIDLLDSNTKRGLFSRVTRFLFGRGK